MLLLLVTGNRKINLLNFTGGDSETWFFHTFVFEICACNHHHYLLILLQYYDLHKTHILTPFPGRRTCCQQLLFLYRDPLPLRTQRNKPDDLCWLVPFSLNSWLSICFSKRVPNSHTLSAISLRRNQLSVSDLCQALKKIFQSLLQTIPAYMCLSFFSKILLIFFPT